MFFNKRKTRVLAVLLSLVGVGGGAVALNGSARAARAQDLVAGWGSLRVEEDTDTPKPLTDPKDAVDSLEKMGVRLDPDKSGLLVHAHLPLRFGRMDKAVLLLQQLPKLAWLSCYGDDLSKDAFQQLATIRSLEEFELHVHENCQFLPWKSLRTVRCIRLSGDKINDALLEAVTEMPAVTSIHLNEVAVTANGLAHLKRLRNLDLVVIQSSKVSGEGLMCLGEVEKLTRLTLGANDIEAGGFEHLGKLTRLTYLSLESTRCTDDDVVFLKPLANLLDLDLGYNPGVTDAGLRHLTGLKKLASLRLYGTKVTDDGVADLKKALPKLVVGK